MSLLQSLALALDARYGARRQRRFAHGWPSMTRSDIQFHSSGLVQYRYRERAGPRSDSPTVVFSADPPVTLEMYDELLDFASREARVIVFELPAMGFSASGPNYRFGFAETNDDIAAFLSDVAGPGAVLAFSCVAGLGAIDIARRHPGLVSRLVLLQVTDVAGFARWKAARDPHGVLARPLIGQWLMRRMAPKRLHQWFRLAVASREQVEHFACCAAESMDHGALWSLASAYQSYIDPGCVLEPAAQPALALWGSADRSHMQINAEGYQQLVALAESHRFEHLGHFMELEAPGLVWPLIAEFATRPH